MYGFLLFTWDTKIKFVFTFFTHKHVCRCFIFLMCQCNWNLNTSLLQIKWYFFINSRTYSQVYWVKNYTHRGHYDVYISRYLNISYVYRSIARVVTNVVDQRHEVRQSSGRVGRFGKQRHGLRPLIQIRLKHQQSGFDGDWQKCH